MRAVVKLRMRAVVKLRMRAVVGQDEGSGWLG